VKFFKTMLNPTPVDENISPEDLERFINTVCSIDIKKIDSQGEFIQTVKISALNIFYRERLN
jgi:hypothetical protein